MAWLQPVFDDYRNRGMKANAERVQLASSEKGKNARSDLLGACDQTGASSLRTEVLLIPTCFAIFRLDTPALAKEFLDLLKV
jgi:hypothetical protein